MADNSQVKGNQTPGSTAPTWWSGVMGKVLSFCIALVISIVGIMYTDMKGRVTTLEDKVAYLQQDKVSKAELRDELSILRAQVEGTKADILSRQDSLRSDILGRLDLMVPLVRRAGME